MISPIENLTIIDESGGQVNYKGYDKSFIKNVKLSQKKIKLNYLNEIVFCKFTHITTFTYPLFVYLCNR